MSMYPTNLAKPQQIRQALSIYRVMAIVAGLALFVLIVLMFLKYGPTKNPTFTSIWSPIHGVIFMIYAWSIANLGFKTGWSIQRIILNIIFGAIPVMPFIAERKVHAETEALLARSYFAGDAAGAVVGDAAAHVATEASESHPGGATDQPRA